MLWVVLFYIVNYVKHVKYCTVLRVINLSESCVLIPFSNFSVNLEKFPGSILSCWRTFPSHDSHISSI